MNNCQMVAPTDDCHLTADISLFLRHFMTHLYCGNSVSARFYSFGLFPSMIVNK